MLTDSVLPHVLINLFAPTSLIAVLKRHHRHEAHPLKLLVEEQPQPQSEHHLNLFFKRARVDDHAR
jgi:hypothetical protein